MASSGGSVSPFDRAGLWAVLAAVPAVIGGVFVGVALAQFSKPHARTNLWSYGWFTAGIAVEVIAYLILNWAIILVVAHRHAEKHIETWKAANPSPTAPTPDPNMVFYGGEHHHYGGSASPSPVGTPVGATGPSLPPENGGSGRGVADGRPGGP
jgi:hypothetical protein